MSDYVNAFNTVYKKIDQSKIKVGDHVCVLVQAKLGWGTFRYFIIVEHVVARITPARTKFVMEDGTEINNKVGFYELSNEAIRRSHVAERAIVLYSNAFNLYNKLRESSNINAMSDNTILEIDRLLKEAREIIESDKR